jgi:hypothetical protein
MAIRSMSTRKVALLLVVAAGAALLGAVRSRIE